LQLALFSACAAGVELADHSEPSADKGAASGGAGDMTVSGLPAGTTMPTSRGHGGGTSGAPDAGAAPTTTDAAVGAPSDAHNASDTTRASDSADANNKPRDANAPVPQDGPSPGAGDGGSRADAASPATGTVWRPFNDQSPWNTPVGSNPALDPGSPTMIADLTSQPNSDALWVNIQDYSVPVYWVDSKVTPMVKVTADVGSTGFRAAGSSDSDAEGNGLAPIPAGALPALGTDRHLAIVDRTTMVEWGFWDANHATSGWTTGLAATMDLKGTGVRPPEHNAPWWAGHGARACGFPLMAGLVSPDEIRVGRIEHALVMAYPHIRSRYYTSPASSAQAAFMEATPDRGILCGGHVQLDPALNVAGLGLSAAGLAIATALQKYGAFVGDYSGAKSIYADASPTAQAYWATGVLNNDSLSKIPLGRFRVLTIGTTYDNGN
jgi:hypothetical protein